jgi:SAM-dependent methyltransferase
LNDFAMERPMDLVWISIAVTVAAVLALIAIRKRGRPDRAGVADSPLLRDMDLISRDDVVDCYLRLLGRKPESEKVITNHLQAAKSYKGLVNIFLNSEEYRQRTRRFEAAGLPPRTFVPISLAHNEVETVLPAEQLQQCLDSVKAAWTRLGRERAHHSVLTTDEFLPDRLGEHIETFWASGEHEALDMLEVAKRYVSMSFEGAVLNELGAGVGRVSIPFSRSFGLVNAYDISAAHLAFARERAKHSNAANIRFHEVEAGTLPMFAPCDVFYSCIVLQHNPPPLIMQLIARMLACLRPGGLAIFQVPTYIEGYRFSFPQWKENFTGLGMEMHALPMNQIFKQIAEQHCVVREAREDGRTGDARMISTTFVAQKISPPPRS